MNKSLTKSKFPLIRRRALCVICTTLSFILFFVFSTDLTNLIIIRNSSSVDAQGSPSLERNKFTQIQFRMIKYKDLKLVSMHITWHHYSHTFLLKCCHHSLFSTLLQLLLMHMVPTLQLLNHLSIIANSTTSATSMTKQRYIVIYDGYNIVSVCMFLLRRKALDRDPLLASSKATKQTFVMGRNTRQRFSWKSLMLSTETGGRWVSSD